MRTAESGFQRFKDILQCVGGVPKEDTDKAIVEEAERRRQGKEKVKNG